MLNGFHPYQIEYFTSPTKSIVVTVVRSSRTWKQLRTDLIGTTDPTTAVSGAIRRSLLEAKSRLGIPEVSKGQNGVHLSAGPVEGLFEIARFFGHSADVWRNANMFAELRKSGVSDSIIRSLEGNPIATSNGATKSIFDLTEEMDTTDAASLVRHAQIKS